MSKDLTSKPLFGDNFVEHDGYRYYIMKDHDLVNLSELIAYDAIIIDGTSPRLIEERVSNIRKNLNQSFFLIPVFLLKGNFSIPVFVEELIDGNIFSLDQINLITPIVHRIHLRNNEVTINTALSYEAQLISKILTFMYSRELTQLNAQLHHNSGIGFSYPILSVNFEHKEEHRVLDILQIAEKEGVLLSEFHDRTHLCSQCHTGFLAYRECCPKCGSANSESQDIIHHFVCGFVGPISDFQNEIDDQLNCPKCTRTLRHIGVDYDKPSVLHECFNCGHKFQDFNVRAKCVTCTFDNDVQQLIAEEISNYTMSKKGEMAAVNGFTSTSKDIEEIIGTVKLDTYKTMLKYEIERIRQTDGKSNICAIHIANSGQLYSKIGSDMQKSLLKDMVELVRRNIRSSDMITFYDSSTILLSMNDIPLKVGQNIISEICALIEKLLKTNFSDIEADIDYNIKRINFKLSNELQIQQVIKDFYPDV